MAKIPRARYFSELEREAVHMAIDEGFGVSATARRLTIPMNTLSNWVAQYRQDAQGFATGAVISEQGAKLLA